MPCSLLTSHHLQVHASARALRLLTLDADGTIYPDGAHMQENSENASLIVELLRRGVHVAIVTAAGMHMPLCCRRLHAWPLGLHVVQLCALRV